MAWQIRESRFYLWKISCRFYTLTLKLFYLIFETYLHVRGDLQFSHFPTGSLPNLGVNHHQEVNGNSVTSKHPMQACWSFIPVLPTLSVIYWDTAKYLYPPRDRTPASYSKCILVHSSILFTYVNKLIITNWFVICTTLCNETNKVVVFHMTGGMFDLQHKCLWCVTQNM